MTTRSYRTRRAGSFNPQLPSLSPAFISADDAARWAHELILGQPLDREYGGVILKQGTLFFASRPVPDQEVMFDHRTLLATDAAGDFIMPPGYTGEAYYHSHPEALEEVRRQNPEFTSDQLAVFQSFFSIADLNFIVDHRKTAATHYLTGPHGSLLRYQSSGSKAESDLFKKQQPVGVVAPGFEFFIRNTALAGDLRVIVPVAVWGGARGRIGADWTVNAPATEIAGMQPFFTQVFDRPELAVLAARTRAPDLPAGRILGFVLRHTRADRYVATFPQAETAPLFSPVGVFPEQSMGKLRLPSNFRLEAVYYRSRPSVTDLPPREAWLHALFYSPKEMLAAIVQARATQNVQDPVRGLALYMNAEDGAWLRFQLPAAQAPSVLEDAGTHAAIMAGTLTPRDYVRRVIAAGDLSVVQPGSVWRQVGVVENRTLLLTPFYSAVLSLRFVSAIDAAVYVHETIGSRRDRPYGGYILKGDDGQFVITEPMESQANPFASPLFFPLGDGGPLIPPEPYEIHGRYGSHVALSMVDLAWVEQRRWTRDAAAINLQVFATEEIRAVIQQGRPAYLSGAEDCLLVYTPSQSVEEQRVLASTAPQPGGSRVQRRLDNGLMQPAAWVVELAKAGDLRVIQGNALWGPRSPVYADWTPNFTYAERQGPPDYITYGAIFTTADNAARDLHSRVQGRDLPNEACFAFILKHPQHEQYIATEVVGVTWRTKLFQRSALFAHTDKDYVYRHDFVPFGLFRSQLWQPRSLTLPNAWLTRSFVLPEVLYSALYDSRRWGELYKVADNLPIYLSTGEGALLRYRVPGPFGIGGGGVFERALEATQSELASGIKSPVEFVRERAARGQLHVLRTSQCWDVLGPVGATWEGYATLVRRRLTPVFASPDDVLRHLRELIGQGRRRAYAGVVFRRQDGLFMATEPLAVPPHGFSLEGILPDQMIARGMYPAGTTVVAYYHSMVKRELAMLLAPVQKAIYTSMIPTSLLSGLLHQELVSNQYLIGDEGSVLRYSRGDSLLSQQLKADLAPRNLVRGDPGDNLIEQQLRNGELLPAEFVSRLAKVGDLRVISGNPLWSFPRRLPGEFVPYTERLSALDIRAVQADPAFSPIFTQADDAVRSVARPAALHSVLSFGYLLKSMRNEHYQVTLPMLRQDYWQLEQVFPHGLLPQGYAIVGIYLCAPSGAIAGAGDPLAWSFFKPQAITGGLNFVKKRANGGYWPLYLLCADDALLSYRFAGSPSSLLRYADAEALFKLWQDGTRKVIYYVLQLAGAGTLDILRESSTWTSRGRVTADWQPGREATVVPDMPQMVCGPLCAHADDAARHSQGLLGFTDRAYLGGVLKVATSNDVCWLTPIPETGSLPATVQSLFSSDAGVALKSSHPTDYYRVIAVHAFYKAMTPDGGPDAFERALRENFIAAQDLKVLLDTLKRNTPLAESVYLSGRGGALLKYQPTYAQEEAALLGTRPVLQASQFVSRLRGIGRLSVLHTDAFWTRRGLLGQAWRTQDVQAEPEPEVALYGRDRDEL